MGTYGSYGIQQNVGGFSGKPRRRVGFGRYLLISCIFLSVLAVVWLIVEYRYSDKKQLFTLIDNISLSIESSVKNTEVSGADDPTTTDTPILVEPVKPSVKSSAKVISKEELARITKEIEFLSKEVESRQSNEPEVVALDSDGTKNNKSSRGVFIESSQPIVVIKAAKVIAKKLLPVENLNNTQKQTQEQKQEQKKERQQKRVTAKDIKLNSPDEVKIATTRKSAEILVALELEKGLPSKTHILNQATFLKDSYKLSPKALGQVGRIAKILKNYRHVGILISGHTDNIGTRKTNRLISLGRAESVRNALAKNGVKRSRIKVSGKGESTPLVSNITLENRLKNRRIDILILK